MLKGVIRGFLGTYVSRNSDYNGALLFGDVIDHLAVDEINLTESILIPPSMTAEHALIGLARFKFQDQMTPEHALTALARFKFQESVVKKRPAALCCAKRNSHDTKVRSERHVRF